MLLSYASVLELLCVIYYDSWFCHNLNTSMEKGLVSSYVLMNFQFLFANLLNIIFCIMSDWEAGDAFFSSLLHVLSQFIVFVSVLLQVVLGFFCNGISILVLMETTYHAIFMQWYLFNLILCMLFFPSLGWRQWIGAMWWSPWETCCKID